MADIIAGGIFFMFIAIIVLCKASSGGSSVAPYPK